MRGFIFCILLCAGNAAFSQSVFTLEECKTLALKNNAQAKNAGLSVEIAEQQQKEAFTNYFPSVQATGLSFAAHKPLISMDMSAMMQPMMDVFTPTMMWLMQQGVPLDPAALQGVMQSQKMEMLKNGMIAGVQATQPVFAGGRIINGNRLAKVGVEVRQLQKQITENEVLLETERYFWQLVLLNEKMKTIENSDTMLARIHSDVKAAVAAGLTMSNDLLRVELEQNRLQSGKLKLANGLALLKMALGQKIGVPADNFDIQQPVFDEISPISPETDDTVLQNRPEYRLLEKSVEAARLQRSMETGKNLPTIAIGAGYNYIHFDMHKDAGMKNNHGIVFANVSIPITDWWSGSHATKRKTLELQQAENTRTENAELLLQQMKSIQNSLQEAYQQVLLAKKSIFSAEQNLKVSADNYNAGITTLSNLLEAQNLLQQSRDQYTETATDYFVRLAEWKQVAH